MQLLSGKRTYLVAAAWGLATALEIAGVIDASLLRVIEAILLPLGLAALRAGMK